MSTGTYARDKDIVIIIRFIVHFSLLEKYTTTHILLIIWYIADKIKHLLPFVRLLFYNRHFGRYEVNCFIRK